MQMKNRIVAVAVATGLAAGLATAVPVAVPVHAAATGAAAASVSALVAKAKQSGMVRVIVRLDEPAGIRLGKSDAAKAAYTSAVRDLETAVLGDVLGISVRGRAASERGLKLMAFQPMFSLSVSADEIRRLAADPRVRQIEEDALSTPQLLESLKLIRMTGASGAYAQGADGAGQIVAILDTGVDKTHEFLLNKVVSEACYNTTDAGNQSTTRCPGGAEQSTAAGSGIDCTTFTGCGHGTHVAGIAAGKNTSFGAGEPRNGVAKAAKLIAINIFSRFDKSSGFCSPSTVDCLLSYTSDQILGLERVLALSGGIGGREVASINMSLGGGKFTGFCDTDTRKTSIDNLRGVGIATAIASGNNGYTDSVSAPGCISTAITVGSSTKKATGQPERMSSFTNEGPQVDLLAPGGDGAGYPSGIGNPNILSSRFSTYQSLAGTSMATPHVAGAIAAIRSKAACSGKTVSQIESALRTTGKKITDHRTGSPLSERRLDVPAAIAALGC